MTSYSESEVKKFFEVGSTWESRDLLVTAAKFVGKLNGFSIRCDSNKIICNRGGTERRRDRNVSKRNLVGGSIMTGCTWAIKLKAMSRIYTNGKRSRSNYKGSVRIISFCGRHKNCYPSAQNKNMTAKRSAEYTKGIPVRRLWTLVTMMKDNNMILSSSQIRSQLRGCLPSTMNVSKQMVYQLRLKVWRLFKKFNNDPDFQLFEQALRNPDVVGSINDKAITDDEALIIAKDVWVSLMHEKDFSPDGSDVRFLDYLQMIALKAKGFVYEIARDGSGTVVGAVWQTATMRDNFERFGDYICLDVMKRELNHLHWPYIAMSLRNELEKVCVCAEGIVATEKENAYKFLVNFVLKYSPGRDRSRVYVLSGDGFFSQEMIKSWGLLSTHFIDDHWHLFESTLPKRFNVRIYQGLEKYLRNMAFAKTEHEFEEHLRSANAVLKNLARRDASAEDELRKLADYRAHYATYKLMSIRGWRGLRSSTASEQNHSSVLSHLYDGNKRGNYYQSPETYIKDLFVRIGKKNNEFNEMLALEKLSLDIELRNLIEHNHDPNLIAAAKELCLSSYNDFKKKG